MKLPHKAHVALVDGKTFTMMRNGGNPFEPKLEGATKPELSPTNYSAGARNQENGGRDKGTSTQLDELAHAAAVAEWINAKAIAGEIDDLLIIADPKSLGEMRRHYHTELKQRLVGEIDKTLTGETTDRIEQAITAA